MNVKKIRWWAGVVVACLIKVSVQDLSFENLTLNQSICDMKVKKSLMVVGWPV